MATTKPRFSVTFTDESFAKIQEYQKANKITTQSKAVARLVELAISEIESESDAKKHLSVAKTAPGEVLRSTLMHSFDLLNQEGKEKLVDTADDMVHSGKYIKSDPVQLGKAKDA
ncbi:MAG: hypothetical protein HFF22_04605 [Oscillospiraceae bacterium]|nr:hypothetical protein [Oscillospiraceae bacterium]